MLVAFGGAFYNGIMNMFALHAPPVRPWLMALYKCALIWFDCHQPRPPFRSKRRSISSKPFDRLVGHHSSFLSPISGLQNSDVTTPRYTKRRKNLRFLPTSPHISEVAQICLGSLIGSQFLSIRIRSIRVFLVTLKGGTERGQFSGGSSHVCLYCSVVLEVFT